MAHLMPKRRLENIGLGITGFCVALVALVVVTLIFMVAQQGLSTFFVDGMDPIAFFTGQNWIPEQERYGALPMIVGSFAVTLLSTLFALPVAILVHSVTAWIFGLEMAKEGWYSAIMAPLFVVSAMDSGLALLLLSLMGLNKAGVFHVEKKLMSNLAGLLATCIAIDGFLVGCEALTMAYPGAAGAETLYAPEAGLFSSAVDGFEYLAPEDLEALTPRDLAELMAAEPESAGTMKLVSGWRWYFAAALTQAEAARFSEGDKLRIELPGLEAEARVESIGEAELGRRVIVLSSAEALARSLELRVCEARLCPEP